MPDSNNHIKELALRRFYSGQQVYDWKSRKLRPEFGDEIQAGAVLVRANKYARKHTGKQLQLSYLEKRLLRKAKIHL
jgi:hypothetical protein